jgi:hypothetical protein
MRIKRLLGLASLATLLALAGCESWCERKYNLVHAPSAYPYQPACCVPCCPPAAPATMYAPPPQGWNHPNYAGNCACPPPQ